MILNSNWNMEIKKFDLNDRRRKGGALFNEVFNYQEGHLSGENNLKDKADFTTYTETVPNPLPKFKFRKVLINEFKNNLIENISLLLD